MIEHTINNFTFIYEPMSDSVRIYRKTLQGTDMIVSVPINFPMDEILFPIWCTSWYNNNHD